MALLDMQSVGLAFGGPAVLENVSFHVDAGERIGLLGRNGVGKSTLLRVMAGEIVPDTGAVLRSQGLRVALVPQSMPRNLPEMVRDAVYPEHSPSGIQIAEQMLSLLQLPPKARIDELSGGMQRRVLLARALAAEPDLLLLDEPTNHLDISAIRWLEDFLLRKKQTLVFVTHDRAFLRALANRIVELERGRLLDFACDYNAFLTRKQEWLHAEELEWKRFDRKLSEEEIWIRRGIKARRTRNEGRVRALERMRRERRERRERLGTARFHLEEAARSGQLVAELKNVTFGYGEMPPLMENFSATVMRGDRIGIVGPNGAGKTTLLKLILGELVPRSGMLRRGTNLEILYFDQQKEQLDPSLTVQQNLCGDRDTVVIGGKSRHIVGYLRDFLFTPDRIRTPVSVLSGGERNRLLLARLFTRPANVLVLDEPTNDLDLETLDLLEELLAEFQGTVFVVSHDREFLNRTVTGLLVFEAPGRLVEYTGGYDDWLRQSQAQSSGDKKPAGRAVREAPREKQRERRLSFKEKRELDELPGRIEALELELQEVRDKLSDPDFYRNAGAEAGAVSARLTALEAELESAYARWEELEALEK